MTDEGEGAVKQSQKIQVAWTTEQQAVLEEKLICQYIKTSQNY